MKKDEWIFDVNLEEFETRVLDASHEQPVMVDFWADWCSPCLYLDPVLKEATEGYEGQILLAKVEVDEGDNMKLAGRYGVRGFPTVILFAKGEETGRFSSARSLSFVEDFIHHHADID